MLISGIIGLWLSAEFLIWTLGIISRRLKISQTFIGLTILSIGTTLPEIGTHIASSIQILKGVEASGIAMGSNVGSNLMQITLILGIVALFMRVHATRDFLKRDYSVMMGAIALLFVLGLDGRISRLEGLLLAALYLLYLRGLGKLEHFVEKVVEVEHKEGMRRLERYFLYAIAGMAMLLLMGHLVVMSSISLSRSWGVENSLVGALIVGFGTALPEFATAVSALRRRLGGMSIGVLVGSNITNPLWGVGIGAMISGYKVDRNVLYFDIPAWFLVSSVVLAFLARKGRIGRKKALVIIILYFAYVFLRLRVSDVTIL